MIKVYSKPNCMQCEFTKKFLKDNGLQFEVRDVFVADGHEPFAGFRPDKLDELL